MPEHRRLTTVARRWLRDFERCVRAVDYASARPFFARGVYAFGTYAAVVRGTAALERDQWRHIWPSIRRFTFRLAELHCVGGEDGLCVLVPWDSLGVDADGTVFPRDGRATFFLVRQGGRWLALHSHFSLAPSPPVGSRRGRPPRPRRARRR
jgi:ketosteroid isomerase-like protein